VIVQEYLLNYLLDDENKHTKVLKHLESIKYLLSQKKTRRIQ